MSLSRLTVRFDALRQSGKKALITFITAGDPDLETSSQILAGLPGAGADIIELSVPFSDPMADGPTIQQANTRALAAGISLQKVIGMVAEFRKQDTTTPIVLMGYYNPIFVYGVTDFLRDAKAAGVDGLIVVDLPPEEDAELCTPAKTVGLDFIRLITPTTDAKRLPTVLRSASGFLYYVSMAGITGTKAVELAPVEEAITELRRHTKLPIAVGFGISTPEQVSAVSNISDGAIVGSAIVQQIANNLDENSRCLSTLVQNVLDFVRELKGKSQ